MNDSGGENQKKNSQKKSVSWVIYYLGSICIWNIYRGALVFIVLTLHSDSVRFGDSESQAPISVWLLREFGIKQILFVYFNF